jgi:hypothetical protein
MPLSPPPRDAAGQVVPHDHHELFADDVVYRRISREHIKVDAEGRPFVSSMAFQESSEPNHGMSIDIDKLIVEAGLDPFTYVVKPDWPGSVQFLVGDLRGLGFQVGYDPLPPDLPHHGEVWGIRSKPHKRALKKAASWHVEVVGVALGD